MGLRFFFVAGQVGFTEGADAIVFHEIGLAAPLGFAVAFGRRLRSILIAGAALTFGSLWNHDSIDAGGRSVKVTVRDQSTAEQRGWYLYDFGQSAFSTTVVTLFLGPYLTLLAKDAADSQGMLHLLGIPIDPRSYWSYMVSLSVIVQVLFLPVVGAIADYGRRKKAALGATAYLGAAATMAMFLLHGGRYLLGGMLFLIANVSFGAGVVIYNSFLPEIAPPEDRDAVSSKGWGAGYIGGVCCWR